MRVLTGREASEAMEFMFRTARFFGAESTCLLAKCGATIEKDGRLIGGGFNSPPHDESNRKCELVRSLIPNPRHDQTCCVHAEWRAILNALSNSPAAIAGSTLYFARVNERGKIIFSGPPYCTVCSRLALDVGIKFFSLWHNEGITVYDTKEYNDLSYAYERPTE